MPALDCPPTTADLFFLRSGGLWTCPAAGGPAEQLPVADPVADAGVASFEISGNSQRIAYVSVNGEAWVLDRANGRQTRLPTSGRLLTGDEAWIAFAENGRTIVYLAWGVHTGTAPSPGTHDSAAMLAMDVITPTLQQRELADCWSAGGRPCMGFLIAPTGDQAAYVDSQGVWLLPDLTGGESRLLATLTGGGVALDSWSPDGRWLLLDTATPSGEYAPPSYALLATDAKDAALPPRQALCSGSCGSAAVWSDSVDGLRLWLAWDDLAQGCIASVDPSVEPSPASSIAPDNRICQAQSVALHPGSPLGGPPAVTMGGLVAFHQREAPGIAAGIYAMTAQAELRGVALLPDNGGRIWWSSDGGTFLYTAQDGSASHLGSPAYGVLWDVADLLRGAHEFQWHHLAQD